MIILYLKLDNVLAFNDFEVSFSYPNKLRKTTIPNEHVSNIPSFRYKKVNIFMGTNATGKTSLMKVIWNMLAFLNNKDINVIKRILNNNKKESSVIMDFIQMKDNQNNLNRVMVLYHNEKFEMDIKTLSLKPGDSYEKRKKDFDKKITNYLSYPECVKTFDISSGWNIVLPATDFGFDKVNFIKTNNKQESGEYLTILNNVLKTLDPSIEGISKINQADNAYIIKHENIDNIVIQDGMSILDIDYLSSGTKYGINLANIIFSIKKHRNGIYLVDEQFSYVNSEIESSVLSTMISLLGDDEQLFFTTHNTNILDMNLPFHSFYFMKKEKAHSTKTISVFCASEVENRNNVSAKTIVDNDIFATAPDTDKIFALANDSTDGDE